MSVEEQHQQQQQKNKEEEKQGSRVMEKVLSNGDITENIFDNLDYLELERCICACRTFRKVALEAAENAYERSFWRHFSTQEEAYNEACERVRKLGGQRSTPSFFLHKQTNKIKQQPADDWELARRMQSPSVFYRRLA